MNCSKSNCQKKKKINSRRTLRRSPKHPVTRKPGGFPQVTKKLFFMKYQSVFSCVYWAGNHLMALWSERADQAPRTRMKKWLAEEHAHKRRSMVSFRGGWELWLTGPTLSALGWNLNFAGCQVIFPPVTPLQAELPLSSFSKIKSVSK